MLKLDAFQEKTFDEVFQTAVQSIETVDTQWNNYQLYDPGITLIELFSWLKVVQSKQMNEITKDSLLQLFKLLNISMEKNKPSKTLLEIGNIPKDITVPKGTKWTTGAMIFENTKPIPMFESKIKMIQFVNPDSPSTVELGQRDRKISRKIFGDNVNKHKHKERSFTISFDKPITPNEVCDIYFDISSKWSKNRNPIPSDYSFIEMANIKWEYYTEKDGVKDWYEIDEVKDNTHNFLFSDCISFKFYNPMQESTGFYKIRATLLNSEYDYMPVLKYIGLNIIPVEQKDSVCEHTIIKKKDISKNMFTVRTYLSMIGKHDIFVNCGDGSWIEFSDYIWKKDEDEGYSVFQIEKLDDIISNLGLDEDAVMVVSYLRNRLPHGTTVMGSSKGTVSQVLEMECTDVYCDDFDIMLKKREDNRESFEMWSKVDSMFYCSKYDKSYMLDWAMDRIKFGDNNYGKIPDRIENGIRLVNLAYTKGKFSNIKAHIIDALETESKYLKNITIDQIIPATGGRNSEDFLDLMNKPIKEFNKTTRAVSFDDYKTITRNTPGLVIDTVKVLPGNLDDKKNDGYNWVTLAIHKGEDDQNEGYLENYSKNIKKYFENYRLINTHIDVVGASYVDVSIVGEAIINTYDEDCRRQVEEKVTKFIKQLNTDLGSPMKIGDLFALIESLDCVVLIKALSIIPYGGYIKTTKIGDVIVQPNGYYRLKDIKINYLKDTNF